MSEPEKQGLTFPLRSGESCALQGETLAIGQRPILLRDIVSAGLVADTSVAVPPGMPPTPGVSLRLGDGATVAFTPVEQLDCWRLLNALIAARPELATPLPPPPSSYGPTTGYMGAPGYGYGPGYYPGYGAPSYGPGYGPGYSFGPGYGPIYGMAGPTETEKTLAGICHLSVFFAPVILPLIIWLAMRRSHPYASSQAKQAFWFHLVFSLLAIIAVFGMQAYILSSAFASVSAGPPPDPATVDITILPIFLVGYGALAILGLINMVFSIIAAVHGFQGKPYHYPLLGWLRP